MTTPDTSTPATTGAAPVGSSVLAASGLVLAPGGVTARALYAAHLAALRKRAGLSLQGLADQCHYEQSYLHRLEGGGRIGTLTVAETLDHFYDTDGLLVALWQLAKRELKRLAVGGMEALETAATSIQEFALATIPDLLQTPAYAGEHLANSGPHRPEALSAHIETLRRRQARLTDTASRPVRYRAVLDEAVLHRAARNAPTWTNQLDHLITAAHDPAITLHILPAHTGPHLLAGPVHLLSFHVGRDLAAANSALTSHVTDDPDDVDHLRQTYDALRDTALNPAQTIEHLHTLRTTAP
ncbi:helix-turn-helix domain-containing protein [Actinacidiphila sp. bgisy144]|uniref:helix-turn-helix domain-containing protein n=1 Tax=Actinacidiphila sp. bgisy144 TaxID=3413791 RepID=UPI003EBEE969